MLHIINCERTAKHQAEPLALLKGSLHSDDRIVLMNLTDNMPYELEPIIRQNLSFRWLALNDKRKDTLKAAMPFTEIDHTQLVELCVNHTPVSSWY
ncbi:hypothetical protein [Teredinibacter purpureus]|jgi:hypothetical protein|uniref:hypothetical protein n=1 Tax=Teredinibacter purpureus TaxID=2731756 RepID=UPI0005F82585|nr:hypothetical protein [Teredinibacter purpureus]